MFNEITQKAIKAAFENPTQLNENLVDAQQARRVLDRLVGYKVSPILWDKVRRGLSAGRVQTVALRVIVEREREIRAFVPKEYWTIHALLAAGEPPTFEAKLTKFKGEDIEVSNEEEAKRVVAVDLRGREDEPPPAAERDDLVHGHLGHRAYGIRRRGSVLRMTSAPVELHVVSDATGETAARLVQALEAQFPDQEFVEIRHPRIESEEDLHLAVNRMKGRPAVVIYTIVQPELRHAMRTLCRRTKLHYCDLLGHPIEAVARVSGMAARMTPGSRPPLNSAYFKRMEAIEFAVRFDDGVGRGLEDADIVLVGVSRTSKTPLSIYLGYLGHKSANVPVVKGIEPPPGALRDRPAQDRRSHDQRRPAGRDPPRARTDDGRAQPAVRGAEGGLRRARGGGEAPPAPGLPGDRHLGAVDRGDGASRAARRRGAPIRVRNEKGPSRCATGRWVDADRRRGLRLLRAFDADLDRAARRRLARGVSRTSEALDHRRLEGASPSADTR